MKGHLFGQLSGPTFGFLPSRGIATASGCIGPMARSQTPVWLVVALQWLVVALQWLSVGCSVVGWSPWPILCRANQPPSASAALPSMGQGPTADGPPLQFVIMTGV